MDNFGNYMSTTPVVNVPVGQDVTSFSGIKDTKTGSFRIMYGYGTEGAPSTPSTAGDFFAPSSRGRGGGIGASALAAGRGAGAGGGASAANKDEYRSGWVQLAGHAFGGQTGSDTGASGCCHRCKIRIEFFTRCFSRKNPEDKIPTTNDYDTSFPDIMPHGYKPMTWAKSKHGFTKSNKQTVNPICECDFNCDAIPFGTCDEAIAHYRKITGTQ